MQKKGEESVGISNRLLTPCHTRLRRPPRGPFSYQGVSTRGVRHSPDDALGPFRISVRASRDVVSASWRIPRSLQGFFSSGDGFWLSIEGSLNEVLLRRVLRRRLVRVSVERQVLRRVLRRGGVL